MVKVRKLRMLVFVVFLSLVFMGFFAGNSTAQSAEVSFSDLRCETLNNLAWHVMSHKQVVYARQCDVLDAARQWEVYYGNLDEEGMAAAVVHEP
ncbi:hypothetical protein ACEPPX_03820 [Neisseria sp. S1]